MAVYDNEMRGALFEIDKEKRSKNGPIMRGTCEIRGEKLQISVWSNTAKSGKKYWSLRFREDEEKDERRDRKPSRQAKERSQAPIDRDRQPGEDDDDAIPFG